jgi:hypothetical protein
MARGPGNSKLVVAGVLTLVLAIDGVFWWKAALHATGRYRTRDEPDHRRTIGPARPFIGEPAMQDRTMRCPHAEPTTEGAVNGECLTVYL